MPTENKVLGWIVLTICILGVVFGVAAIFLPDFRDNGAFIVGTILGALASLASIMVGTEAARRYTNRNGGANGA